MESIDKEAASSSLVPSSDRLSISDIKLTKSEPFCGLKESKEINYSKTIRTYDITSIHKCHGLQQLSQCPTLFQFHLCLLFQEVLCVNMDMF